MYFFRHHILQSFIIISRTVNVILSFTLMIVSDSYTLKNEFRANIISVIYEYLSKYQNMIKIEVGGVTLLFY